MYLKTERWVSDQVLIHAIELRFSRVFGALNVANALGGGQSDDWQVVRGFSPRELLDEARARKLPLETIQGAVEKNPLTDHPLYKRWLAGEI